ncbi:MAG: HEAT repeat domain-containing protein [Heteroscytonema crispum UTEX LB 1556]
MNTLNFQEIEELISQLNKAATAQDAIAAIKAIAFCGTKEPEAIAALITALSHHHPSVGAAAVEVLVKLAPATVEPLIAAFYDSTDQGLQAYIIQALAQIGDKSAIAVLAEVVGTEVANHCQGNVRRIAARGLGKMGNLGMDKLTWALLTPEDWGLRYAAAVSLEEIATPEAKAALKAAIAQESDKVVQQRIRTALELI